MVLSQFVCARLPLADQKSIASGHWYWGGDTLAEVVCKQLGYQTGSTYTFGHTNSLPRLPVVAGFRRCAGSESNIFGCPIPDTDVLVGTTSPDAPAHGQPVDMDCLNGCVGPDHIQGTADDTLDPTCPHSLDQGAICHNEGQSQVALPGCNGCGIGCAMTECNRNSRGEFEGQVSVQQATVAAGRATTLTVDRCCEQCNYEQPVVFGCIDYCISTPTFLCVAFAAACDLGHGCRHVRVHL